MFNGGVLIYPARADGELVKIGVQGYVKGAVEHGPEAAAYDPHFMPYKAEDIACGGICALCYLLCGKHIVAAVVQQGITAGDHGLCAFAVPFIELAEGLKDDTDRDAAASHSRYDILK